MNNATNVLNIWKQRNLSLIILKFLYLASNVTTSFIKSFDRLITDFIWNDRRPTIKKNVIIQDKKDGGLKAPDFLSMVLKPIGSCG